MIRNFLRTALARFPTATQFYRNSRDLLDQHDLPITSPWGFTLAGHKEMATGKFEPQETKLVRELLLEVDVMVNVGANVGYYCCHALSMNKPVIAVEPNTRNLHYLLKNIQNNGWAKLAEVFPVAMGNATDILKMWGATGASLIKGWAAIPESYVAQVPVLSLDRIIGNTLNGKQALILVDIEGAELMMLHGAGETLAHQPRPIWMVEIATTQNQPDGMLMNPNFVETFDIFFSRGYRAYTADDKQVELTSASVNLIAAGKKDMSVYNFLFR